MCTRKELPVVKERHVMRLKPCKSLWVPHHDPSNRSIQGLQELSVTSPCVCVSLTVAWKSSSSRSPPGFEEEVHSKAELTEQAYTCAAPVIVLIALLSCPLIFFQALFLPSSPRFQCSVPILRCFSIHPA